MTLRSGELRDSHQGNVTVYLLPHAYYLRRGKSGEGGEGWGGADLPAMACLGFLGLQGFLQGCLCPIPLSLLAHAALWASGQLCCVAQAKDPVHLIQHLQAITHLLLDLLFPAAVTQTFGGSWQNELALAGTAAATVLASANGILGEEMHARCGLSRNGGLE